MHTRLIVKIAAVSACLAIGLAVGGCRRFKAARSIDTGARLAWFASAILDYEQTKGRYPDSLESLRSLYGAGRGSRQLQLAYGMLDVRTGSVPRNFDELLVNPLTGDNPGYEYVKPTDPIKEEPMIYQLRNGKRDEEIRICYSTGSVRRADHRQQESD